MPLTSLSQDVMWRWLLHFFNQMWCKISFKHRFIWLSSLRWSFIIFIWNLFQDSIPSFCLLCMCMIMYNPALPLTLMSWVPHLLCFIFIMCLLMFILITYLFKNGPLWRVPLWGNHFLRHFSAQTSSYPINHCSIYYPFPMVPLSFLEDQ